MSDSVSADVSRLREALADELGTAAPRSALGRPDLILFG